MDLALALARRAQNEGEVPVGAILVKGENLVGEGWNRTISLNDPTAHAEIMALRDAGKRLENYRLPGCSLFVTLEPCSMCAGAMIHARLDRLVFAASDPKTGAAGGCFDLLEDGRHNHTLEVQGGCRETESSRLLRDFFREKRESPRR